jgi:hypothetical protein
MLEFTGDKGHYDDVCEKLLRGNVTEPTEEEASALYQFILNEDCGWIESFKRLLHQHRRQMASLESDNEHLRALLKEANENKLPRLEEVQLVYQNQDLHKRIEELEDFLREYVLDMRRQILSKSQFADAFDKLRIPIRRDRL